MAWHAYGLYDSPRRRVIDPGVEGWLATLPVSRIPRAARDPSGRRIGLLGAATIIEANGQYT